jgi:enoyl-CoA hydratase
MPKSAHNQTANAENIAVEMLPEIAVVRFVRPEAKNPLSIATLEELSKTLDSLETDSNIKTIIFTGSGDTFASGANLNEIAATTFETAREFALRGQTLMQRIYRSDKLCVAAVNGFCMGGALDLALACRKRIASPSAVFAHPGANLGIMTGWGGTQMLPRLVGESCALDMFLTAKRVSATEALRIGLIDRIADDPLADSIANS